MGRWEREVGGSDKVDGSDPGERGHGHRVTSRSAIRDYFKSASKDLLLRQLCLKRSIF
jgi:hypothetical protein